MDEGKYFELIINHQEKKQRTFPKMLLPIETTINPSESRLNSNNI